MDAYKPVATNDTEAATEKYPARDWWWLNLLKPKPAIVGIGPWGRQNVERLCHLLPRQYYFYSLVLEGKEGAEYGRDELVCYQHQADQAEPTLIGNEEAGYQRILKHPSPMILIAELGSVMETNEMLALAETARLKNIYVHCFTSRVEQEDEEPDSPCAQRN